jgi:hypothetical protein
MDSFDMYGSTPLGRKWTSLVTGGLMNTVAISSGSGRSGTSSFRISHPSFGVDFAVGGVMKTLNPADTTAIVGCAHVKSANNIGTLGQGLLSVLDVATPQVTVRLNPDMRLSVVRGAHDGTVLGTTTTALSTGVWAYLELQTTIHPSSGTAALYINGVSALSLTGVNTRATANTSWNGVLMGSRTSASNTYIVSAGSDDDYDDLYICDGSGSAPWNTVLGDVRAVRLLPTSDGANTGWTTSTGSTHYALVDEVGPNDETDYVSTTTTSAKDTYGFEDLPSGVTVYGVQVNICARKTDAGTSTLTAVTRHSGTDYDATAQPLGTSYAYASFVLQTNPGTSAQWIESGVNGAEWGPKKAS